MHHPHALSFSPNMLDPLVLQELISVSVYLLYISPMYSVTLLVKDVSSEDLPDAAEPNSAANTKVPTTSIESSTSTAIPMVPQSMGPSNNLSIGLP